MLLRQLGVCLWWRAAAFYHGGSVGALGEGVCPACWPITPLQTPLVLSNPLRLTTLLSERREDLFIHFFAVFIFQSVWRPLFLPTGLFQTYYGKPNVNNYWTVPMPYYKTTSPYFEFSFSGSTDDNISKCFFPFDHAMWIGMLWIVSAKTKWERGTEGGWEGMLGKDVPQIR